MSIPPRILAFAGSARRESFNQKLLSVVVGCARAAGAEVMVLQLRELALPIYDGDLEEAEGMPAGAQKLVELITHHQGLLIATPEYNSQMPPLLKNAIDWATRAEENPLAGKVAAVVSASPGNFGGIRSMTLARQLLTHLGCHVIPAQCILPQADRAFDESGRLKDARAQRAGEAVANQLVAIAAKLGG
jgi:chromate reductase, NAD(P)H dehydrogenase (quinone)